MIELNESLIDNIPASILVYKKQNGRVSIIYTNAYYRSLPSSSEAELMSLDQAGLIEMIHPEDRSRAHDFFLQLFDRKEPGENSYRSRSGKSPEYRWYHLNGRPVPQSDGSVLAYVVFTDITVEKETELNALRSQQMYRMVAEKSKLIIFEYDREHRRIVYQMDSAYTRAICEAQGMPQVIENVPESLVALVDEPFRESFLSAFSQIGAGAAETSIEYSSCVLGRTHWWHVTSMPLKADDGTVLTIYCYAQDITEAKLEQQRYLDFFRTLNKAYPDNLGSFHLNLTKNICIEGTSPLAFVMKQKESGTVDGYFAEFSKLIADKETLAWLKREFTLELLLKSFQEGKTSLSFQYSIHYPDGLRWREGILIMQRNPQTDDVEALTYALDIDRQKRGEMILQTMSREGSDFIGFIDVASGTFAMHSGNGDCKPLEDGQRAPYSSCIESLCRDDVLKENRGSLREQADLENIKKALAKNKEYSLLYDFSKTGCQPLKKRISFKWFNPEQSEILVLQSDITEIWKEEQERLRRIESQRLELQKYEAQIKALTSANSNFAASYHLNISKDICTTMLVQDESYSTLKKLAESGTVTGLFEATAKTVPDRTIAGQILSLFNPQSLIQKYEQGETNVSMEYPCHSAHGGIRWILGTVNMVRNPESGDIEGITYAIDINDRKKNELVTNHITEQEFELTGLLYLRGGEIEIVQKKANIALECGQRIPYEEHRQFFQRQFADPEELDSFNRSTDLEKIRTELVQNNNYAFSYLHTDSQGRRTCQQLRLSWLDREHEVVLFVRSDVTVSYEHEEKQLEKIQKALIEAETACSAKNDFVSRISHDIRTPIGAISNITAFAFEDIGNPEKLRDDLRRIQVSNVFLLSLINDVLDISKIDSGKMELHPAPYNYADFVSSIRNMFEPLCEERKIHFAVGTESIIDAINIDQVRFNQLAMNLVSNAIKYTPEGGSVTVSAHGTKRPDGLCDCVFRVADTGIGMSEAFQKTMFEPFTQETDNPMRDRTMQGSGLGLALVKKIADLMGGTLSVKSRLGKGTEISLSFTAEEANSASSPGTDADDGLPSESRTLSGKVLLAEDNEINMEIAKRILESFGLEIIYASNGQSAVEQFSTSAPAECRAILMDIQMPIMNGYDATSAIRALNRPDAKSVPIIAMTADAFTAAVEHSKSVGMSDYVTKPLDIRQLYRALARYM